MYIKVNNMNDFISLLTTYLHNDTNNVKIVMSSKNVTSDASFFGDEKSYVDFKFVLFTPLYQVIYLGKSLHSIFDDEFKLLLDIQDKNNSSFHIQVYETIKITSDYIMVENDLKMI